MIITVLGGGSWGTSLAVHLARNEHQIKVWEFFEEQAKEMQEKRHCKLLPNVKLDDNVFVTSNMKEALDKSNLVLIVVPSDKVESTLKDAIYYIKDQPLIICSKGFGSDLRLLTEVAKEKVYTETYCLYGPTHAEEVCKGLYSGIVLAGPRDAKHKIKILKALRSDNLKVEFTTDLIGVQVSAALKNILAVFIGILDGMKLGDNAKAYFITKGLAEIKKIGLAWGGKEETFYGLAGLGDVIVTCTSDHSRNRYVGLEIGKGRKLDNIIKEMNMVAEGVTTIESAIKLKKKFNLDLPLIECIYNILFNNKDPKEMINKLEFK